MGKGPPWSSAQQLVEETLAGNEQSRAQLSLLLDEVVQRQTDQFCRRYCRSEKSTQRCTLKPPEGSPASDAPLCDWANASYGWMLGDLTSETRLQAYQRQASAPFEHYVRVIVHSLPFYERWKDWRFGRRVYVPDYVANLHPRAKKIFLQLRDQHPVEAIAQRCQMSAADCAHWVSEIVAVLVARNKLHLLDPPSTTNFSDLDSEEDVFEPADDQPHIEQLVMHEQLARAFQQLTPVEQFVLEAMVIEQESAEVVLAAIRRMGVSLSPKVPAEETQVQQLYYFKRKALSRLQHLLNPKNSN